MLRKFRLFQIALLFALMPQILPAHAVLLQAVPAAGSVLAGPSIQVELKFNSRIDGKRSRISLITPDNQEENLSIGPQPSPEVLTAPAKHLLPGAYKIHWQVLAIDGHITRGEVPFRIK